MEELYNELATFLELNGYSENSSNYAVEDEALSAYDRGFRIFPMDLITENATSNSYYSDIIFKIEFTYIDMNSLQSARNFDEFCSILREINNKFNQISLESNTSHEELSNNGTKRIATFRISKGTC